MCPLVLQGSNRDILTSVSAMYDFKKCLFQTEGETLYLFWMDVEHLKCHQSYLYVRKLIIRIGQTYVADSSPFPLVPGLRESLVSVQRTDEPQNRWDTKQQVKELVQCQAKALLSLREYWCQRYGIILQERGRVECREGEESRLALREGEEGRLTPRDDGKLTPRDDGRARDGIARLAPGMRDTTRSKSVDLEVAVEKRGDALSITSSGIRPSSAVPRLVTPKSKSGGTRYPLIRSSTMPSREEKSRPSSAQESKHHLPAVGSKDSLTEGEEEGEKEGEIGTKRALHIKTSTTSKMPPLSGSMFTRDGTDIVSKLTSAEPNPLISSSMYSLFSASSSSSSLLRLNLREEREDNDAPYLDPFVCATLRADFTSGNPFLRYLKATGHHSQAVNCVLFWQSVENILTQDEMRRWYTGWCVRHLEGSQEDRPSPYLSFFEPYVVARNPQELCLFFLQPKSPHKVRLPKDVEQDLAQLLPRGLGQGLLLAAQEHAVQVSQDAGKKIVSFLFILC